MKDRFTTFFITLVGATLLVLGVASYALAEKVDETDLKSDLELELEGIDPKKKKSQDETKKRKLKLKSLKSSSGESRSAPRNDLPSVVLEEPKPAPPPPPPPVEKPAPVVEQKSVVVEEPQPAPPPVEPKPVPVSAPAKLPTDIEGRMALAQEQLGKKQCDAVITNLRPLNDVLPRSGLLLLARAYACKEETLNEIRTLELCIAKNPKDYVVRVIFGQALVKAKRVEDGLMEFQEARNLNQRYKPAYDAMLKELEKKGERYEARNVVNDMLKTFGPKPEFFTTLCRLYSADSFHEKTVEICEKAIQKDPKTPENHVYLGLSLKDREETAKAQAVLKRAARRFPASESVQSAMGELHMAKKDYVSAYNFYKQAAAADPKSPRAWVGYGIAAFELQKNDEALKAFVKGCEMDRHATKEFRSALGRLRVRKDYMWQGRFEMGINSCQ